MRATLQWLYLVACMLLVSAVSATRQPDGQVGQLGERCYPSGRCSVQQTVCVKNVCRCENGTVPSARNNRCLIVSSGLKHHCEEDVQCMAPHSFCRRKYKECDCQKSYIISMDKSVCLPESRLGESCQENAQCKDSTECSPRGVCVCQGISYEFNGECVTDHNGKEWELTPVTVSPNTASRHPEHSEWLLTLMLAALTRAVVR